jgi:hypothetical protein
MSDFTDSISDLFSSDLRRKQTRGYMCNGTEQLYRFSWGTNEMQIRNFLPFSLSLIPCRFVTISMRLQKPHQLFSSSSLSFPAEEKKNWICRSIYSKCFCRNSEWSAQNWGRNRTEGQTEGSERKYAISLNHKAFHCYPGSEGNMDASTLVHNIMKYPSSGA